MSCHSASVNCQFLLFESHVPVIRSFVCKSRCVSAPCCVLGKRRADVLGLSSCRQGHRPENMTLLVLCPQLRRMQEMIARMQAQMQLQMHGGDGDGGAHGQLA